MLALLAALALPSVALEEVVAGLARPVDAIVSLAAPAGSVLPDLLVVEQEGRVIAFADGERSVWLDLRGAVETRGWEQGLLALALPPPGHRLFGEWAFVHYSALPDGRTRVSAVPLHRRGPCPPQVDVHCPLVADRDGEVVILEADQPYGNHNGGEMEFGPDGMLWLALGDGGAGGDPEENGQDRNTVLGAMVRIDPTPGGEEPYEVPEGNPFRDGGGAPEIYHWGLRNPWKFSFDAATGDLWIADVGQNKWEEIDLAPAGSPGLNYGWNDIEGRACFEPPLLCNRVGRTAPVAVYGRDEGQSVTGGFVYRGEAIDGLKGLYLFGDFGSQALWALDPATGEKVSLGVKAQVSSFAQGPDGEVYVLDYGGRLLRFTPS